MSKFNIEGIENYDKVHRYIIRKEKDLHGALCSLLDKLGFSEDSVLKVDVIFDDLYDEYIYISGNGHEIHIFITKEHVNLVIKTDMAQKELNELLKKFFYFPQVK